MKNLTMFSNFMELIPDATVILDVRRDKVVYVNASCKKLLDIKVATQGIAAMNS